MTTAMTRNIRPPRRSRLDPTITGLALMMMVERLNYYATTNQVVATRDELLDTLVERHHLGAVRLSAAFGGRSRVGSSAGARLVLC